MDPAHAILFEPVKIGPVTAPNRFYQTPHATGFGWQRPQASAALRGVKAEGGWGVVCTEYCSIHPTSDDSPSAYLTLWGEEDVAPLAATADAIHAHGAHWTFCNSDNANFVKTKGSHSCSGIFLGESQSK